MLCELDFEKKKEASNKEVSTKGLKKEKCRKPDGPCIQHDFSITYMKLVGEQLVKPENMYKPCV